MLDVLLVTGRVPLPNSKTKPLWGGRLFFVLPDERSLADQEVAYWIELHDRGWEIEGLLVSRLVSSDDRPKIERDDISRGVVKSLVTIRAGIGIVLEIQHWSEFFRTGLSGVAR